MSGPRTEKIADQIQREVARLLMSKMHDQRLGFVTVTGVDVSGDLGHARIFVSILSQGGDQEAQTIKALESAKGFVRSRLARSLRLKRVPQVSFAIDRSIEQGARIEDLLRLTRPTDPDSE